MTRGDLPWTVSGRTVKPLAFAQMLALLVIAWAYLLDAAEPQMEVPLGDVTGVAALVAAGMLMFGWAANSQRWAEIGLLIGAGVWVARASVVALVGYGTDPVAFWLSLCWAVSAGGAFMLESMDWRVDGIWTRPSRKP